MTAAIRLLLAEGSNADEIAKVIGDIDCLRLLFDRTEGSVMKSIEINPPPKPSREMTDEESMTTR